MDNPRSKELSGKPDPITPQGESTRASKVSCSIQEEFVRILLTAYAVGMDAGYFEIEIESAYPTLIFPGAKESRAA